MNELVVSKNEEGLRIAILQESQIVELQHEKASDAFAVGDLFVGRVKRIAQGLNAAFVDVGHEKDAFLHYLDLGPQILSLLKFMGQAKASRIQSLADFAAFERERDIEKTGKMDDLLKNNQDILVQVVKEPISTKGPRLSGEISLPGQYVVVVPFSDVVTVSKKIRSAEERRRLRTAAEAHKPAHFGVIVRTAAEGKSEEDIRDDIADILEKWQQLMHNLPKARAPYKVLSEGSRATSILRDMLSLGFDTIHVDDKATFEEIKTYLEEYQPDSVKSLKMHRGRATLYHTLGIEKQIKASFGKVVTMASGSYLVVEHTEAMHVIDVNSGSKNLKDITLEETALKTNLEAAREIARQLRLRDMGGIVVIDFIDQRKIEHKKLVYDELREAMKTDRAKHTVLPMSKFGLVQITRQRVRPQIDIVTTEECPSCGGTGKIQPSILLADEVSNNVNFILQQNKQEKLRVVANPFIVAYLKQGGLWRSLQWQWFRKHWRWVEVVADAALPFTTVHYYNQAEEEIKF